MRGLQARVRVPVLVGALVGALLGGLSGAALAGAPLQPEQEALQTYEEARQALAAGRLDEAELLLERVLMLMPEHAEARLEFALLLARRGQPEAARALILGLAQDPRTPGEHRQRLQALADQLLAPRPPQLSSPAALAQNGAPASPGTPNAGAGASAPAVGNGLHTSPPARWRAEASLAGSTNPLSRTAAEGVTLTLPDGPITLPLSTRPQASTVAGFSLLGLRGSSGVDLSIQEMDSAGTATAYRAAAWGNLPALAQPAGLPALQWQLQTLRGFDNLRRHAASLAVPAPGGAQRLVLGAYAEPTQEDRGWLLRAEHRASGPAGLAWQASAERSASTARAQGHWRLNLALEVPLGPGRRLQAQATAQEDTHAYSPLLQNNSHRRLWTRYVGFEQHIPWGGPYALVFRLFHTQRSSNLAIFAFRDTGAQLALARQW